MLFPCFPKALQAFQFLRPRIKWKTKVAFITGVLQLKDPLQWKLGFLDIKEIKLKFAFLCSFFKLLWIESRQKCSLKEIVFVFSENTLSRPQALCSRSTRHMKLDVPRAVWLLNCFFKVPLRSSFNSLSIHFCGPVRAQILVCFMPIKCCDPFMKCRLLVEQPSVINLEMYSAH